LGTSRLVFVCESAVPRSRMRGSESRVGEDRLTALRVTISGRLGPIADEWDHLVNLGDPPSPFLRSWWLDAVAASGARLLLVRDGDERLVGGLALEEDTRLGFRRLRHLGAGLGPDHVDVVASRELHAGVVAAIARHLRAFGPCLFDFAGVPADSPLTGALPGRNRVQVMERARWTPLIPDFGAYLRSRPSRLRNSLRYGRGRLTREGVRYGTVEPRDVERALTDLRRLHASRWGDKSLFLPHFERFADAARAGTSVGEMVFHELRSPDGVIAMAVCFEVRGRVTYCQAGRDPNFRWRGSGTFLLGCVVQRACELGFRELDLLRGDQGYKRLLADEVRPLLRLQSSIGLSCRAADVALNGARTLRTLSQKGR
jgi:CelD/BcsL family acetyltransferase involved in cellulose biosynthesis